MAVVAGLGKQPYYFVGEKARMRRVVPSRRQVQGDLRNDALGSEFAGPEVWRMQKAHRRMMVCTHPRSTPPISIACVGKRFRS